MWQIRGEITASWCAAAAAMALITVTTVVGNAAVLAALRRTLRAPAHYPLASLATADLLVGTCVLPLAAARELFVFNLNWALCACWSTLDVLCCTASILSLCALGWERWCGITAPLARAKRTRRARIYAALVWPVATAVALPTAFIPSPRHFHPGEMPKACTVNTNVGYVFFSVSFSFYLPTSVMLVLYTRILMSLASPPSIRAHRGRSPGVDKRNNNASPSKATTSVSHAPGNERTSKVFKIFSQKGCILNLPGGSKTAKEAKLPATADDKGRAVEGKGDGGGVFSRQRRATRTIVTLMSLFLICWTPFFVMLPIDSLCGCVVESAWLWCTWLGYANSAFDPLVYAAASPSVRRHLPSFTTSSSGKTTEVQMVSNVRRG